MLWALSLALTLGATSNPQLDAARKMVSELKYLEAAPVLERARATAGNDFATISEILWLQGNIAASLGKTDEARTFFRTLCSMNPDYAVPPGLSPRVMAPFFEAKGWATTEGRLKFETRPPEQQNGRIAAVAAVLVADPLTLARKVRFHLKGTSGSWYTVDSSVVGARAGVEWAPVELQYFVELLGADDAVIAFAGSDAAPISVGATAAVAVAPAPAPAPRVESSRPFFGPLRVVGSATLLAAAVSVVVASVFAANSNADAATLRNVGREPGGAINGMTQKDAFALDDRIEAQTNTATGFFIGAGVLAVGGGVLFVFGGPGKASE